MNTKAIKEEYRLAHWAGIISERRGSGLSIKAYCKNAGFHSNIYYYWQRKLREAACEELGKAGSEESSITPVSFTEVKLVKSPWNNAHPASTLHSQVSIEAAGVRITAGEEYPADKLAALLRELR